MKSLVLTSNGYTHLLPAFIRQWGKYANHWPLTCVYETVAPQVDAPGLAFYRAGTGTWSQRLINYLEQSTDTHVLLLLDDYFLSRPVDWQGAIMAYGLMVNNPHVHKIDLSGDRLKFAHHDLPGHYVKSDVCTEYLTSTQAAIWRRDFLLSCLRPHEDIWQFELQGTPRLSGMPNLCILGQKQPSIAYANAVLKGAKSPEQWRLGELTREDIEAIRRVGV